MNWLKRWAIGASLVAPVPLLPVTFALAETAAPAAKSEAAPNAVVAKSEDDDSKMSDTDKRAKAVECSKQADAKKLHGEARKKFRSACKRNK